MPRSRDRGRRRRGEAAYDVERIPRERGLVTDALRLAAHQPTIHGLVEVDVTEARRRIHAMRGTRRESPSFTAFVVASLARALAEHPQVNVRRAGSRLVRFHRVDVGISIERQVEGEMVPMPYLVEDADAKTFLEISDEVRAAQHRPVTAAGDFLGMSWLGRIPSPLRRGLARTATRIPSVLARFGPPVALTSVGMFGSGAGWGIPVSAFTLMVCVGGIGRRVVLRDDGVAQEREMVSLTLSFDHAVVDGGPATRFARRFIELLETAAVLGEDSNGAADASTKGAAVKRVERASSPAARAPARPTVMGLGRSPNGAQ